jgi:hypothetical protein
MRYILDIYSYAYHDVTDVSCGLLRYFVGEVGICGIELNDPNGDCDGCDAEGTRFFTAKPGHGLFIEWDDVTLCDASGQPLKKKTTTTTPKYACPTSPSRLMPSVLD